MKKYAMYTVAILIEEGSALAERLEAAAERNGCSVQSVVGTVVQCGAYGHIERNLTLLEQSYHRQEPVK